MSNTQLERQIIKAALNPLVKDGLSYYLRALPPPAGGWYVHVTETILQEYSDSKREELLLRLKDEIDALNKSGVPVGILRTLE